MTQGIHTEITESGASMRIHASEKLNKVRVDLMEGGIIKKKPNEVTKKYKGIFYLDSVTGVAYITYNSPQYISGEMRLRGKDNGQYPYGFKEGLAELFGRCTTSQGEIEVCSGKITEDPNLITVDINPSKNPTHVLDAQILPDEWSNHFDRWNCDPPYSERAAKEMYRTEMPSISRLLNEGARVTKPGGLMFCLLGNKNLQQPPKSTMRIGRITITVVPNQEVRALNCYLKI